MGNYHDPIRQLKYLRQILSHDKKPLGFFLSAGCPLAVQMPEGKWPLIPDVAGLTKYVSAQLKSSDDKINKYNTLIQEIEKTEKVQYNIEDILSFVRGLKSIAKGAEQVRGLSEEDLANLERDICKKIVEKLYVNLPDKKTPYHEFAKWIHNIERDSPVEIFTTNYDLLLEQAFEEIGVPYFDGFVGSREPFFDLRAVEDTLIPKHWTRLWKIHGSINWFQKESSDVFRSTHINLKEGNQESYIIYPSHLKYDQSRKMPYLALIDRLNKFLRQSSSVLIMTGYSFSDEHLNDAIVNALKANPTAMAIVLLFNTLEFSDKDNAIQIRYEKALRLSESRSNLSIWTFDEAVIGGLRGKWRIGKEELDREENIANVIEQLSKPEESKERPDCLLKLGDFKLFGNFLQELIGREQFKVQDDK
ncbi:SIR2 family protein [Ohtaekwangia kribbensis]|uniref:SIR2 family protein n=1 Tax=Ohtaekwangia kribbensis TaxID=688913 RepID=A0ABW3K3K4_9BACT